MDTAITEKTAADAATVTIEKAYEGPCLIVLSPTTIAIRAGTVITAGALVKRIDEDLVLSIGEGVVGRDYAVTMLPSLSIALHGDIPKVDGVFVIGGFHFAPGGNATARAGGDAVPAINPFSCWDVTFRPACADPRGMAYVAGAAKPFWADIYLLGCNPWRDGTSKFGVFIADGDDLPMQENDEPYDALDHPTAVAIFAAFGKQLLSPEEFFAAAFGVTEGTSVGDDPKETCLDAPRTSRYGLMQATGNMSTWGNDGDPDGPRLACRFGGNWGVGVYAGSRCANVGRWPDDSDGWIGARGRSDHLSLGA